MIYYEKYINALRKCAKEHENDRTFTGHIIVSDLCKDTANLLEELEQESFKSDDVYNISADKIELIVSAWYIAIAKYYNQTQISLDSAKIISNTIGDRKAFKESDYNEVLHLAKCNDPFKVPIGIVVFVYERIN